MHRTAACLALAVLLAGCGGSGGEPERAQGASGPAPEEQADHAHGPEEEHAHDEQSIGTATLGELSLELAQGHGALVAGEEAHLVVKLPYSDSGGTIVRAWIGTEDRTLYYVGKGEYAASHDDYDVHATAPDPLPAGAMWWVEIEQPDGTVLVGSARPILE